MATRHVQAESAPVWIRNGHSTASRLGASLDNDATHLGTAGGDSKFGCGPAQAKATDDRITATGFGK